MQSTFIKQCIYGACYLVFFAFIGYGVFHIVRPDPTCFDSRQNQKEKGIDCGGPCMSCEIKSLKPLASSFVTLVPLSNDASSLFFNITNPNADYGVSSFAYQIKFFDSSGVAQYQIDRTAYLYAGEIRTFAEIALPVNASFLARAEVEISDPTWEHKSTFYRPALETRGITISASGEGRELRIQGLVANKNPYELAQVGVGVIVYNAERLPIGATKTVVTDLAPLEERAFTLLMPWMASVVPVLSDLEFFTEALQK